MKNVKGSVFLFIMILCLPLLLSACGESTEEKMYKHLENAVDLEVEFESQQKRITDLETEEQEIYNQIINLGMDEFDKIKELSNDAIKIIEERGELIELEQQSIQDSQEEFMKVKELIDDLEEEEIQKQANKMVEVMEERYTSYNELHEAYIVSLDLEKQMYEMLKNEDIEQEELTEHINKINDSYQIIIEKNDQFNKSTVEYNGLKKDFYQRTGLTTA